MGARRLQAGHTIDDIHGQAEAVDLVLDRQFQRRIDVAFFLVASHVQVCVVLAAIGEPVDQPGIAVEIEDDRLAGGEQAVEIPIAQAMGMF